MSARSWAEVRAELDLDEDKVAKYREQWLAEIEEFRRREEQGEQQG